MMSTQVLEGLLMRPTTVNDAVAVTALINDCAMVEIGSPETTLEDMARDWQSPGFNLESDARVVVTPEDRVIGYMEVFDGLAPHTTAYCWGRVHPDYTGRGIATQLMQFAEERAQQTIRKAPLEARVTIVNTVRSTNEAIRNLLLQRGYGVARHYWAMSIDLEAEPPAPQWPAGITLRTHVPGQDDRLVHGIIQEIFSDHWGFTPNTFEQFKHWMIDDPDFDPTLWFLAMDGDTIAGISLCYPKVTEDPAKAWVAELGVRRLWRRRGLALALLQHSFGEFYRRGKRRGGLMVDSQNLTGATRLYERAGMHVLRQLDRYEKEIRPGVEMSVQNLPE
jgi:mycothiol synthase